MPAERPGASEGLRHLSRRERERRFRERAIRRYLAAVKLKYIRDRHLSGRDDGRPT